MVVSFHSSPSSFRHFGGVCPDLTTFQKLSNLYIASFRQRINLEKKTSFRRRRNLIKDSFTSFNNAIPLPKLEYINK